MEHSHKDIHLAFKNYIDHVLDLISNVKLENGSNNFVVVDLAERFGKGSKVYAYPDVLSVLYHVLENMYYLNDRCFSDKFEHGSPMLSLVSGIVRLSVAGINDDKHLIRLIQMRYIEFRVMYETLLIYRQICDSILNTLKNRNNVIIYHDSMSNRQFEKQVEMDRTVVYVDPGSIDNCVNIRMVQSMPKPAFGNKIDALILEFKDVLSKEHVGPKFIARFALGYDSQLSVLKLKNDISFNSTVQNNYRERSEKLYTGDMIVKGDFIKIFMDINYNVNLLAKMSEILKEDRITEIKNCINVITAPQFNTLNVTFSDKGFLFDERQMRETGTTTSKLMIDWVGWDDKFLSVPREGGKPEAYRHRYVKNTVYPSHDEYIPLYTCTTMFIHLHHGLRSPKFSSYFVDTEDRRYFESENDISGVALMMKENMNAYMTQRYLNMKDGIMPVPGADGYIGSIVEESMIREYDNNGIRTKKPTFVDRLKSVISGNKEIDLKENAPESRQLLGSFSRWVETPAFPYGKFTYKMDPIPHRVSYQEFNTIIPEMITEVIGYNVNNSREYKIFQTLLMNLYCHTDGKAKVTFNRLHWIKHDSGIPIYPVYNITKAYYPGNRYIMNNSFLFKFDDIVLSKFNGTINEIKFELSKKEEIRRKDAYGPVTKLDLTNAVTSIIEQLNKRVNSNSDKKPSTNKPGEESSTNKSTDKFNTQDEGDMPEEGNLDSEDDQTRERDGSDDDFVEELDKEDAHAVIVGENSPWTGLKVDHAVDDEIGYNKIVKEGPTKDFIEGTLGILQTKESRIMLCLVGMMYPGFTKFYYANHANGEKNESYEWMDDLMTKNGPFVNDVLWTQTNHRMTGASIRYYTSEIKKIMGNEKYSLNYDHFHLLALIAFVYNYEFVLTSKEDTENCILIMSNGRAQVLSLLKGDAEHMPYDTKDVKREVSIHDHDQYQTDTERNSPSKPDFKMENKFSIGYYRRGKVFNLRKVENDYLFSGIGKVNERDFERSETNKLHIQDLRFTMTSPPGTGAIIAYRSLHMMKPKEDERRQYKPIKEEGLYLPIPSLKGRQDIIDALCPFEKNGSAPKAEDLDNADAHLIGMFMNATLSVYPLNKNIRAKEIISTGLNYGYLSATDRAYIYCRRDSKKESDFVWKMLTFMNLDGKSKRVSVLDGVDELKEHLDKMCHKERFLLIGHKYLSVMTGGKKKTPERYAYFGSFQLDTGELRKFNEFVRLRTDIIGKSPDYSKYHRFYRTYGRTSTLFGRDEERYNSFDPDNLYLLQGKEIDEFIESVEIEEGESKKAIQNYKMRAGENSYAPYYIVRREDGKIEILLPHSKLKSSNPDEEDTDNDFDGIHNWFSVTVTSKNKEDTSLSLNKRHHDKLIKGVITSKGYQAENRSFLARVIPRMRELFVHGWLKKRPMDEKMNFDLSEIAKDDDVPTRTEVPDKKSEGEGTATTSQTSVESGEGEGAKHTVTVPGKEVNLRRSKRTSESDRSVNNAASSSGTSDQHSTKKPKQGETIEQDKVTKSEKKRTRSSNNVKEDNEDDNVSVQSERPVSKKTLTQKKQSAVIDYSLADYTAIFMYKEIELKSGFDWKVEKDGKLLGAMPIQSKEFSEYQTTVDGCMVNTYKFGSDKDLDQKIIKGMDIVLSVINLEFVKNTVDEKVKHTINGKDKIGKNNKTIHYNIWENVIEIMDETDKSSKPLQILSLKRV